MPWSSTFLSLAMARRKILLMRRQILPRIWIVSEGTEFFQRTEKLFSIQRLNEKLYRSRTATNVPL